jgi:hypothetical protein
MFGFLGTQFGRLADVRINQLGEPSSGDGILAHSGVAAGCGQSNRVREGLDGAVLTASTNNFE